MRQNVGIFSLFLVGGLYAWRNRFRIQQFLESRGIDLPFNIASTGSLSDTVRGGAAKVSGSIERGVRSTDEPSRRAV
jgi:hypothetical protein